MKFYCKAAGRSGAGVGRQGAALEHLREVRNGRCFLHSPLSFVNFPNASYYQLKTKTSF